jgi:hypothetical protein
MSAIKGSLIRIAVTNGDALPENRITGKSNTGSYFVSSTDQYEDFKPFCESPNGFIVSRERIIAYREVFLSIFSKDQNSYPGKMQDFNEYCYSLCSLDSDPIVKMSLRVNDSRVFLKFDDNLDPVVTAIRHILYGEVSQLIIEIVDGKRVIYPEIDFSKVNCQEYIDSVTEKNEGESK